MKPLFRLPVSCLFAVIATICALGGSIPDAYAQANARITLVKEVTPDDTTDFFFTLNGPTPNGAQLDDDAMASGGDNNAAKSKYFDVIPGTYTITEQDAGPGWIFEGAKCTDPAKYTVNVATRTLTLKLPPEANVTCTFFNKKQTAATGKITIIKDALPDHIQDFAFIGTGPAGWTDNFVLDDDLNIPGGNSSTPNAQAYVLPLGSYSFTEPTIGSWQLTGISCTTASGVVVNLAARKVTINLTANANIGCTFTNKKLPTGPTAQVSIGKDATPNSTQDFGFTGSGPNFSVTATLDDDAGVSSGDNVNSHYFSQMLPAGTYVFTENQNTPGWTLTGISCSPANSAVTNVSAGTATVTVVGTQPITCMFKNAQTPQNCTAYPLQATVNIYNPMQPFGPQTVNICRGGTVKFVNVSSGSAHLINPTVPAASFAPVSLAVNPASGTTTAFANPGIYKYLIGGFTLQGTIIVH